MIDKQFVDTNILVYAHDRAANWKRDRARLLIEQLWSGGNGVLSTQVLQEFCVNLMRKAANPTAMTELRSIVQDYLSWKIVVNDENSIIAALEIKERYQLSFWDSLIIHAAERANASVIYSEDLSAGQKYATIEVVNPFVT